MISLGVVTYVYMQRLILQLAESYFMHDKLTFFNHVNPGTLTSLLLLAITSGILSSSVNRLLWPACSGVPGDVNLRLEHLGG